MQQGENIFPQITKLIFIGKVCYIDKILLSPTKSYLHNFQSHPMTTAPHSWMNNPRFYIW